MVFILHVAWNVAGRQEVGPQSSKGSSGPLSWTLSPQFETSYLTLYLGRFRIQPMPWHHVFPPFPSLVFSRFSSPSLQTCSSPFKTSNRYLFLAYSSPLVFSPSLQTSLQAASLKTFSRWLGWFFTSCFSKGCLHAVEKSPFTFSAFRPLWFGPVPFFHFITFIAVSLLQRTCTLLRFPKFPERRVSILPWSYCIEREPTSLDVCMIC